MSACFCTGKDSSGLCACQRASMNNIQIISIKCKCCDGCGIQKRDGDGLKVYCPACQGSGECPNINRNIKFQGLDPLKPNEPFGPNTLIC